MSETMSLNRPLTIDWRDAIQFAVLLLCNQTSACGFLLSDQPMLHNL
jgi:hypothetical protein